MFKIIPGLYPPLPISVQVKSYRTLSLENASG